MWDNTDKQDEGYTDYLTDTGFAAIVGCIVLVFVACVGVAIWHW